MHCLKDYEKYNCSENIGKNKAWSSEIHGKADVSRRSRQILFSSFQSDVYSEKRGFRFCRCGPMNNDAFPVGIYLFKVINRNNRRRYDICSKLKIKTPEQQHWHRSGVFIFNFEQISNPAFVFLYFRVDFEQINATRLIQSCYSTVSLRARDGFIQPTFYKRFDCFSL